MPYSSKHSAAAAVIAAATDVATTPTNTNKLYICRTVSNMIVLLLCIAQHFGYWVYKKKTLLTRVIHSIVDLTMFQMAFKEFILLHSYLRICSADSAQISHIHACTHIHIIAKQNFHTKNVNWILANIPSISNRITIYIYYYYYYRYYLLLF